MNRKIIFAVPTNGTISAPTLNAMIGICEREDIEYHAITGSPISAIRNVMVSRLLADDDATHLLMIDDDTVPPKNIVDLLLECDSLLASAIVPIKIQGKIVTNIIKDNRFMEEWPLNDKPFEVEGVGTGCVLLHRDAFNRIKWPWFRYVEGKTSEERTGEDIYFGIEANKVGLRYKVHPKSVCGHIKKIDLLDIVNFENHIRKEQCKQEYSSKTLETSKAGFICEGSEEQLT